MRQLRALLALLIVLSPQAALACGAMISERGSGELTDFDALLRWDEGTEELLVTVGYVAAEPSFAWLMPLPSVPEVEQGDASLLEEALAITTPPIEPRGEDGEGAGAPPVVGGAPGVDVLGRDTVGGLRFVTLGSKSAAEVTRWMRRHEFAFHDQQGPVIQKYLDRGWVIVAARVAPGEKVVGTLVPVRFRFQADQPTYPLAMAGAGHAGSPMGMSLFVLSPFRPSSTTYSERIVTPDPETGFGLPGRTLELRYSAPLGDQAERMAATPDTWLTRYEANFFVNELKDDLILTSAEQQTPVDFSDVGDGEDGILVWVTRAGVVLVAAVLAIWISLGMARRRRSSEAAQMPNQPPPGA